jgi:hypothetical protein
MSTTHPPSPPRLLSSFPLPPTLLDRLLKAGFHYNTDFLGIGPIELARGTFEKKN